MSSCRWSTCAKQDARTSPSYALVSFVLQNVKPGIGVGKQHQAIFVDENVAGLDHFGGVGPLVDDFFRRRWHEISEMFRLEGIANVVHSQAGIVIGDEHG